MKNSTAEFIVLGTGIFSLIISIMVSQFFSEFRSINMIVYHAFLLPLIGWSCSRLNGSLFFRSSNHSNKKFNNVEMFMTRTINPSLRLLIMYSQNWARGFIVTIFIGIILGYFLRDLTFLSFFISVVLLILLVSLITLTRTSHGSKRNHSFSFSDDLSQRNQRNWHLRAGVLFLFIAIVVFLPRSPVLLKVQGVLGVDTWYTSALASRITFYGQIDFLSGIIGLLEVYPTDKAVVAPLSLALLSIYSGLEVLEVQFFHVLWMTIMGIFLLSEAIHQILSRLMKAKLTSREDSKLLARMELWILSISFLFFSIPTVLTYTDGFLSGRTIFLVFFPSFLATFFQLIDQEIKSSNKNKDSYFSLVILTIFLTMSHRMSLVTILPLVFLLTSWSLSQKLRLKETITNSLLRSPLKKMTRFNSLSHAMIPLLPILAFFFSNLLVIIQVTIVKNRDDIIIWWFNRFYTEPYLPTSVSKLILGNEYIAGVGGGFIGLNIASGGFLFFFLVILGIFLYHSRKKDSIAKATETYRLNTFLLIAMVPGLSLLYQGVYFYQAILHLMLLGSISMMGLILSPYLSDSPARSKNIQKDNFHKHDSSNTSARSREKLQLLSSNRKDTSSTLSHRLVFMSKKLLNKTRLMTFFFVTMLILTGMIIEETRTNRSLSAPKRDERHLSNELRMIADYFGMSVKNVPNSTVIVSSETISLKLSVLLPYIKFLPNHRALYHSYGYVNYGGYQFKPIPTQPDLMEIFSWLKYPFDKTPLYVFEQTLRELLNGSMTNPETRIILTEWNVKFALIEKNDSSSLSEQKMSPLFESIEKTLTPEFETDSFRVYFLNTVPLSVKINNNHPSALAR